MKQPLKIGGLPFLQSDAEIIKRRPIGVEACAVGPQFGDVQRREVEKLPGFLFALADLLFRLLCRGDVRGGAHKVKIACLHRAANDVDVFHSATRHQQTMFYIVIRLFFCRLVEGLPNETSIAGMNSLKQQVERGARRWIVFKNVVDFFRPIELPAGNAPTKTAGLADLLPLGQESFATLQLLMGFLALIDVRNQDIPTDDTAFRVSRWQAAYHEPAVDAVGAKDTVFDIIRVPGFYRVDPARRHHLAFIRM